LFDSGSNNLDAAKVALEFSDEKTGLAAKAALLYVPNSDPTGVSNARFIDLYASYTIEQFTITAGRFLTYIGYEAYEVADLNQLTWGFASGIPGYQEGAKIDFATDDFSIGISVTDALFSGGLLHHHGDTQGD